jgi:hypothetical protein
MLLRVRLPVTILLAACISCAVAPAAVVINEILYRPAGTPENPALEFVELHNTGPAPVNLANWKLDKGVNFTFAAGTSIPVGGYLVVAADPSQRPGALGPWTGSLSNTAEEVRLVNELGGTQDSVNYASEGDWAQRVRETTFNGWDWSSLADDAGHSLERRNAALATDNGQNWAASDAPGGTPGVINSAVSTDIAPVIRNLTHAPASPRSNEPIQFSCEVIDETLPGGLSAALHWRNATTTNPPAFSTVPMVADGAGGFSVTLPPMADKTIVEFYVSASDGAQTRTWPAPTSEGQNANAVLQVDDETFPGNDEVYRLVTTAAENSAFNSVNANSDREFNATLVTLRHAQSSIRYQTGFRIRGASSRNYQFRPLRIAVPADNPLDDVKVFNLNPKWPWNQYLGMKLVQAAGLRAPDARAVKLRRNGVEYTAGGTSARDYGKWVRVDHLDADFVDKHWPLDGNGNLYKKVRPDNSWAYRDGDVNAYLADGWTKESNSAANDWSDLDNFMGLIRGIYAAHGGAGWNTFPDKAASASELNQLSNIADLNQWVRWMAIENFMGNAETNASNGADDDYSMYRGAVSGKFEFVAHDHDTLFGLGEGARPPTSNFFDMTQNGDVLEPLLPLFGTSTVPGNLTIRLNYYLALRELANTVFAEPAFSAFVDNHLGDWVPEAERTAIKNYVATRRATLEATIANDTSVTLPPYNPPAPLSSSTLTSVPGDLRINEVLARNVAAHANGSTFPDVIEIFNAGGAPVDLAGMTLSDDPAIPNKFIFPANTLLANGEYLLVFADSETTAPGLHTGFGLNQDGDQVRLYAVGGALVDAVQFGPQAADLSISRTGGAQDVWTLTAPTLGGVNGGPTALGNLAGVRINELLSNPDYLSGDDFVELYNSSAQPVALGGVIVTDDFINYPARHVLPPLSFIGAQDFVVLRPVGGDADAANPTDLAFKFSSFGTWAAVMGSNGATIDRFDTDTMPPDVSLGRTPDGGLATTSFGLPTHIPTPGAPNVAPPAPILALLNQLRITELLYRPNNLEFVELQNIGDTPLDISGVRFTTGLTYTFPAGTVLAPHAIIVVCRDRTAFQVQFGNSLPLAPGQFTGTLDNSGETIGLQPPVPWDVNILRFRYESTWYAETSADHSLNVDDVVATLPRNWDEKETWFPSANPFGTPGVGSVPVITSPLTANGVLTDPFTYQIVAKRLPESYNATGLPNGLSVDPATGLISGVPSQTGQFLVTIQAINAFGSDDEILDLTISATGPLAGFEWSGVGSAQIEGEAFTATLRAIDSAGRTITSFNSNAETSARGSGGLLVFTEVGTTSPTADYFELQNVGGASLNTSGWFVVTNAGSQDDPSADFGTTWDLPSTVAAGQIIGATDSGTLAPTETPFGANIDFPNEGESGWVMLVDGTGTVRDFISWGYTAAEIASISFTSNGHTLTVGSQWTGNGTPVTPGGQSLFRNGDADDNSAANWALGPSPSPRGTQNAGLTLPWASAFTALPATGVGNVNLVNGVWTGSITINQLSAVAELQAAIPGQPVARSTPFAVISSNSNRPPSFTKGANEIANEDSGQRAVGAWAKNISPGPASESGQTVSFLVSTDNDALFSAAPVISSTGTLTFTPANNAFGVATVTVRARDNGGTADGGQDTSPPQTFTITVRAVNDPPAIALTGTNITRPQTAGPQSIPGWATGISAGPANETGQLLTILISTNNSGLFSTQPTLALDGTLTFTPNVANSGTAVVTVTIVDDGGTALGGTNSFSPPSFSVTLTTVNNPPVFTSGGSVITSSAAPYNQQWATGIAPGPISESGQGVSFQILSNSNPGIFMAQPFLTANGMLTFTPAKVAGTAMITVQLRDTGPNNPATGDDNTGDPVTFSIQLTAIGTAAGKYRGLATAPPTEEPTHAQTGLIEVNVTPKGSFSGKLKLAGKSFGLSGTFDESGAATFGRKGPVLTLVRKNLSPLSLTLQTDLAATERHITGQILEGSQVFAQITTERDAYHVKLNPVPTNLLNPFADKGSYTAAFVAQDEPNRGLTVNAYPQGDGYAAIRIAKSGTLTIRGRLADGTPLSYSSGLDASHRFPLYASLYKNLGHVAGPVAFHPETITTIDSTGLQWFRPAQLTSRPPPQYPQGWPNGIDLGLDGSVRLMVTEPNVLPAGNALLELAGGNPALPDFSQAFTIGDRNRTTMGAINPQKVAVKLKPTGEWSGSFINPGTGKKTTIQGVILRYENSGTGYFLGGSESGHAVIRLVP